MKVYTAFCRDMDDDDGTIWIESIAADSVDDAREIARNRCADDWGWEGGDRDSVECIGIAEGDVKILFWED